MEIPFNLCDALVSCVRHAIRAPELGNELAGSRHATKRAGFSPSVRLYTLCTLSVARCAPRVCAAQWLHVRADSCTHTPGNQYTAWSARTHTERAPHTTHR